MRVVEEEGEPWFVAKDVCEVLGLGNSREAVSKIDEDEKRAKKVDTHGGPQEMLMVSEGGVYKLVLTRKIRSQPKNL